MVTINSVFLCVFSVEGYIFQKNKQGMNWKIVMASLMIGPISQICFNNYKSTADKTLTDAVMMTCYHCMFYTQGLMFGTFKDIYFKALREM